MKPKNFHPNWSPEKKLDSQGAQVWNSEVFDSLKSMRSLQETASRILMRVPEGHIITEPDFFTAMRKDMSHTLSPKDFWQKISPSRSLPLWRIVTEKGELIPHYPGGEESQSEPLIREGHTVCLTGFHLRASLPDFRSYLIRLQELFA